MKPWHIAVPVLCGTLFLTGFAAARSTRAQIPGPPLTITPVASDATRHTFTLRITNTSGKAITAYAYELRFPSREGSPLLAQPQVDGFLVADLRPLLAPGESREDVRGLNVPLSDVAIGAVAVVFEDTTTAGDQPLADVILERRAATRDAKLFWLSTLKEHLVSRADSSEIRGLTRDQTHLIKAQQLANQIGPGARMTAFTELIAMASAEAGSREGGSPEAGVRSAEAAVLRDYLQQLKKASPDEVDRTTGLVLSRLEQEYANAVKHSRKDR